MVRRLRCLAALAVAAGSLLVLIGAATSAAVAAEHHTAAKRKPPMHVHCVSRLQQRHHHKSHLRGCSSKRHRHSTQKPEVPISKTTLPPGVPSAPQPQPSPAMPPSVPIQCQPPALPALPAGKGSTIVGGIIWLVGGPAGQACQAGNGPPLGGTITVETEAGVVVTTAEVAEGQYFEIPVAPGRYFVRGTRYAPAPIPLACGPAKSSTEIATGETVNVEEGQPSNVYCGGDIP